MPSLCNVAEYEQLLNGFEEGFDMSFKGPEIANDFGQAARIPTAGTKLQMGLAFGR